eukprot:c19309_g1_i1 orf=143-610(+)
MGLLDKLWDDVVAGPAPDRGLGRLRRSLDLAGDTEQTNKRILERRRSADFQRSQEEAQRVTQSIAIAKPPMLRVDSLEKGDGSVPSTPTGSTPPLSPSLASPFSREKENIWRSVFNPGSNKAMQKIGSAKFDKPQPNSPSVYDWLYSGETKSKWR